MISSNPNIHSSCFIAEDAVIKGNVSIGEHTGIWYHAVIRADYGQIIIGSDSNVQDNCVIHLEPDSQVTIGNGVTIGHGAIVHGCTIEDNCIIGMGSIIMNDAVIGKNCIVGAGALVTERKFIPDGSLVIGSPAKVVRSLTNDEIDKIKQNASHYVHMASEYKQLQMSHEEY